MQRTTENKESVNKLLSSVGGHRNYTNIQAKPALVHVGQNAPRTTGIVQCGFRRLYLSILTAVMLCSVCEDYTISSLVGGRGEGVDSVHRCCLKNKIKNRERKSKKKAWS